MVNVLKNESSLVGAAVVGAATDPPTDTAIPVPPAPNAGEIPASAKLAGGSDGKVLNPNDPAFETALQPVSGNGGVYLLDRIDLFNLLCVPGESNATKLSDLQQFCRARRAFLIADCAADVSFDTLATPAQPDPGITGDNAINAAFYFPWVTAPDPLQQNRPTDFPPCGFVAGLYARTDSTRGVWKAPAGTEASLTGVVGVKTMLTNDENGVLNPKAVNCIRTFPGPTAPSSGARAPCRATTSAARSGNTFRSGAPRCSSKRACFAALKWVVFEPNDEPLWAQIRLNVGAFMHDLFRQGAFQGKTPQEAYFVKCDKETTTQNDINLGIVNIVVGFAPLKPAEFVVIKIQQIAGQIQT